MIAAIIGEDNEILPIVEGKVIRIYDEVTRLYEDYRNPALDVTEGRRGAALTFAQKFGITAFVAPPETFCDLSYRKARDACVKFLNVSKGETFNQLERVLEGKQFELLEELPEIYIVPSQQHSEI